MSDLGPIVDELRSSVVALMAITPDKKRKHPKQAPQPRITFGTAWCVAEGGYFATARHALNDGRPIDPTQKFYLLSVPGNQHRAYQAQVQEIVFEDELGDFAIVRIAPDAFPSMSKPLPVMFEPIRDGTQVLSCGFPSPQIEAARITVDGEWRGGTMQLKSFANTGMVAGQYATPHGQHVYELTTTWYNGESGPVCLIEPLAAFTIMQRFRNVNSPLGTQAGPRQGNALSVIKGKLMEIGAKVVHPADVLPELMSRPVAEPAIT